MAAADITIGDEGGEFEADGTQKRCTLTHAGNWRVRNTSATQAVVIAPNGATVQTTQPGGAGQLRLLAGGAPTILPHDCKIFDFKASASGFIQVEKG